MSCSFITATYMVEAMAAANATLRLRKAEKNLSVSTIIIRFKLAIYNDPRDCKQKCCCYLGSVKDLISHK